MCNIKKCVLTVSMVFLMLGGCHETKVSDTDILLITESQLLETMNLEQTVVVDVRKPQRYAEGHLPGAINIFYPEIRAGDTRLSNAQQIVVYGDGWTDPLAAAAAKKLMRLGYENVFQFSGGIEVWKDANRTLVKSASTDNIRPETDGSNSE